jgi:hypothetical protein
LVNGYRKNLSGWINGDFDGNGTVDGNDLGILLNSYRHQTAPLTGGFTVLPSDGSLSANPTPIPEPASLLLLSLGSLALLQSRRRGIRLNW